MGAALRGFKQATSIAINRRFPCLSSLFSPPLSNEGEGEEGRGASARTGSTTRTNLAPLRDTLAAGREAGGGEGPAGPNLLHAIPWIRSRNRARARLCSLALLASTPSQALARTRSRARTHARARNRALDVPPARGGGAVARAGRGPRGPASA